MRLADDQRARKRRPQRLRKETLQFFQSHRENLLIAPIDKPVSAADDERNVAPLTLPLSPGRGRAKLWVRGLENARPIKEPLDMRIEKSDKKVVRNSPVKP